MAGADSTVRVNILGDAKDLQNAAKDSNKAVKGMGSTAVKVGGIIAGAFAADAVLDFGRTALAEADRVADATARLEGQLGTDLTQALDDASEGFTDLGASRQDMLELEAGVADVGTALGITDAALAPLTQDVSEAALALSLLTDTDAETWAQTISKAAGGSGKALKLLGVDIDENEVKQRALKDTGKLTADSLTEGELAAARYKLILEELEPRIGDVVDGQGDFESKTLEVNAKLETLTGKIGEHLEGPLADFLDWILAGITGWELFAGWLDTNADKVAELGTPLGVVADWLGKIVGLIQELNKLSVPSWLLEPSSTPGAFGGNRPGGANGPGGAGPVTVNVNGGSPEAIEQAVRNAVNTLRRHGG